MKTLTNNLPANAYSASFVDSGKSMNNSSSSVFVSAGEVVSFDSKDAANNHTLIPILIFTASTVFYQENQLFINQDLNTTTSFLKEVSFESKLEKVKLFETFTVSLIKESKELEPEFAEILNNNFHRLLW